MSRPEKYIAVTDHAIQRWRERCEHKPTRKCATRDKVERWVIQCARDAVEVKNPATSPVARYCLTVGMDDVVLWNESRGVLLICHEKLWEIVVKTVLLALQEETA